MRLLYFQSDGTLAFTDFGRRKPPPYAILSHTWDEEEVTLQDLCYGVPSSLAFKKIAFCGEQAAKDGLKFFWVDTCCIDRNNLPELTRSINSMFRWYHNASKCYVYLSDVSVSNSGNATLDESSWMEAFWRSRWFTRGWTLQELIAPPSVEFFSKEGQFLGDKSSLRSAITGITNIPAAALQGRPLSEFSVKERFAWANHRETSEEEDIAYCLLGIFNVFMPLIPGEGAENAWKRLEKLVEESSNDDALGGPDHTNRKSKNGSSSSKRAAETNVEPKDAKAIKSMKAYALRTLGSTRAIPWPYKPRRKSDAQVILNHWHRAHAISQELAQGANAGTVFQGAHASFLNDAFLYEHPGFETFGDAQETMANIESHCKVAKNSSRLLVACKSVGEFCLRWAHFFDVVELGMTIDPEWPRTLWGAIRLVFVRCKDFVNMFEKIAQMFDRLKQRLPSYHDHVLRLREDCPEAAKSDLCKALAIVYADILQFCQDACGLFQMSPGASSQTDPVKTLTFIPFVTAFDDLLERVAEHKRLFDISLRDGKHDDLQAFIRRVVNALKERDEYMHDNAIKRDLQTERGIYIRRFYEDVRKWIQAPDYKPDFDKARDARSSSTGDWLHAEASYIAWKADLHRSVLTPGNVGSTSNRNCSPVLWLEGTPGFGKTVLSTAIIEDLQRPVAQASRSFDERIQDAVAYFFFNAQLPGKRSCFDAFRAIALQVVEALLENSEMIDVLSLSMLQAKEDRTTATLEDLAELLRLALRRLSSLALVLDGIDECQDFDDMWTFLGQACGDPRFKCLCLSQPSIKVPPERVKHVQCQSLHGKNRQDILKYLQREIQALQEAGHLEVNAHPGSVAKKLSVHAKSSFLWANLIISYLRSPSLSPMERLSIVEDPGQLDSLHGLFTGILRQCQALYLEDRNLRTKVLQFLVLAREPLSVDQLNIAISTKPGRKLERSDLQPDFSDTLKKLCGSLIEVTDSAVLFSHLSFRAFLESHDAIDLKSPFRIDKKTGSLQFAVVCLSYLIHHVPQGPISGSHETAADQAEIEQQLPLSKYAARHWVDHAVSALRLMPGAPRELIVECYHILQLLGSFIRRKSSISAWIEICWIFKSPASIEQLWLEFESRLAQIKITAQRGTSEWRIFETLSTVRKLSEDLERLNEHWSHLLLARPYEIWGPSISIFLGSVSWAHNEEATITMVASDGEEENLEETILKVSRLSSCGKFIGIVRLTRKDVSSEPHTHKPCVISSKGCACEQDGNLVDLKNTAATYQILKLEDGFPMVNEVNLPLDPDDLHEVESTAEGSKFRFPVSFTPNLQSISILHTLYWIGADGCIQQQRLAPRLEFATRPRYYKMIFSPCGQFVARLERQQDMNKSAMGRWDIIVWKRQRAGASSKAANEHVWKVDSTLLDIYSDFTRGGTFTFNPRFLQIALFEHTTDSPDEVSVWNFGASIKAWRSYRTTRMVYATGLHNLHISSCGRYLFGDHPVFKNPRIVSLERYSTDAVPVSTPAPEVPVDTRSLDAEVDVSLDVDMDSASEDGYMHVVQSTSTQLMVPQNLRQPVLLSNELALTARNGISELSILRRNGDGGLVLKRLSAVADRSEHLLYLPRDLGSTTSVSVIDDRQQNQSSIRMVLTNDFEDSYTWGNPLNRVSASVITRSAQSIKTIKNGAAEISSIPDSKAQRLLSNENDSEWQPLMDLEESWVPDEIWDPDETRDPDMTRDPDEARDPDETWDEL
jgi:hypothetical protein